MRAAAALVALLWILSILSMSCRKPPPPGAVVIAPGRSIGPVRLGMTMAEVRAAIPQPKQYKDEPVDSYLREPYALRLRDGVVVAMVVSVGQLPDGMVIDGRWVAPVKSSHDEEALREELVRALGPCSAYVDKKPGKGMGYTMGDQRWRCRNGTSVGTDRSGVVVWMGEIDP